MYLWDMGVYIVVNLCLKVHGKLSSGKALKKKSALVNVLITFPFSIIHTSRSTFRLGCRNNVSVNTLYIAKKEKSSFFAASDPGRVCRETVLSKSH